MFISKYSLTILAILPVIIWSSSALVVKSNSLANEGIYIAYYAVVFASLFSFIFTFFKDKKYFNENIQLIKKRPTILLLIILSACFICGHYLSIYYVFSTDYVVKGNIINYLWPLFYFILSTLFIKDKYSKASDFIFIIISFIGAIFIISGKDFIFGFSQDKNMLVLSLFAAFCASLYILFTNFLKKILVGSFMFFSFPLMCTLFISLPIHFYFDMFHVRINVILIGLFLGFFSIYVSNILWVMATSKNIKHSFSSLAYLVPVVSTTFLVYFKNLSINNSIVFGLFLIVSSNILLHYDLYDFVKKLFFNLNKIFVFPHKIISPKNKL